MKYTAGLPNVLSRYRIDAGIVVIAVALLAFGGLGNHANVSEPSTSASIAAPGTPPPLSYVRNMTASHADTPYSLDTVQQINGKAVVVAHRPRIATIERHRQTVVGGWAVDGPAQRAADAVFIRLDGKVTSSCHIGIARPDVAAAYGVPAYTMSGFTCTIEPNRIETGRHAIELDIVEQGGHTYYVARPPTVLVVR